MDDWSDAMSSDDSPDEKCNASGGDEVGFDGKEMTDLVYGEPNSGQAAKPEEEEADEIHGVCA